MRGRREGEIEGGGGRGEMLDALTSYKAAPCLSVK
uniref:Uncharacterized protein n=1 Tax=Anguilla anguilla TaxID=7936 RepID=A0A0E9V5R9_ANGAN